MTAVSGTFSGALAGAICKGGAFAHVESQAADDGGAPTVLFFLYSSRAPTPRRSIRFQSPANVTSGQVNVEIGLPSASPGTYAQAASCGNVVLIAASPPPIPGCAPPTARRSTALTVASLPGRRSCASQSPRTSSYAALGAYDCVGDATTPPGSWTLTLTSLTADPAGPDSSSGILDYAPTAADRDACPMKTPTAAPPASAFR